MLVFYIVVIWFWFFLAVSFGLLDFSLILVPSPSWSVCFVLLSSHLCLRPFCGLRSRGSVFTRPSYFLGGVLFFARSPLAWVLPWCGFQLCWFYALRVVPACCPRLSLVLFGSLHGNSSCFIAGVCALPTCVHTRSQCAIASSFRKLLRGRPAVPPGLAFRSRTGRCVDCSRGFRLLRSCYSHG